MATNDLSESDAQLARDLVALDDALADEMAREFFGEPDELAAHLRDDGTLAPPCVTAWCEAAGSEHCPLCGAPVCASCLFGHMLGALCVGSGERQGL